MYERILSLISKNVNYKSYLPLLNSEKLKTVHDYL